MTPIYSDTLPGGSHWSMTMRRHTRLRLTDVEGGGNCAMLFYNPINLFERYNAPDTLKCQHTFRLTTGHCLYSDMGRIFCSIVADTVGWHDTVCGSSNKAMVSDRYGPSSYQKDRHDWHPNGRDSFLIEATKYGLGRRDLAMCVNWFSKVVVGDDGSIALEPDASSPGATVELRFEMDTLVLFHTCPHPMNPATPYPRKPIQFEIFEGDPAGADDPCRLSREENARGFENNRLFHAGCGCA